MVGYHWSLAWWFGADDCNFWCFHTNFYNQNTIISWKLQTISISNSKLWSVIFDTWTLKFTILLPVWSKNSACDTNSPQSWHNPYYSECKLMVGWTKAICSLGKNKWVRMQKIVGGPPWFGDFPGPETVLVIQIFLSFWLGSRNSPL